MAQTHAQSGQVVSVLPLGDQLKDARTTALLKADQMEIVRVVMLAGHEMREHKAPGEITVQCIEGRIEFRTPARSQILEPGDLIHLRSKEPHALQAITDSSALVTMRVGGSG
jgi:quercetin dioxygenase-like cupin family protein